MYNHIASVVYHFTSFFPRLKKMFSRGNEIGGSSIFKDVQVLDFFLRRYFLYRNIYLKIDIKIIILFFFQFLEEK